MTTIKKSWKAAACAAVFFAMSGLSAASLDKELAANFLPTCSDMLTFTTVSQKLHEMDVEADLAWTKLKTRAEYDAYRKQMHAKMMAAMGEWPERTALNAKTVAVLPRDGYRIEKVIFESMPGLFVTANLFVPDSATADKPHPAIVLSCGHSGVGKDCDIYLRACVIAVRNGFVALMYDPYEQGERRQHAGMGSTHHHNIIGLKGTLLGWSMPLLRTWDGMRAVDYAESRPEVDKDRIGFMGQSGGGTMTALMTACDWRLKATAPSCYLTSLRHLCESMGPQDGEQNIYGQLAFGLNHTGYVLLPDTKVAVTCRFRDMFSIYGTLDLYRTVQTLASKLGVSEHYALNSAPGPHGWTESTETASVDWMRAWLMGDKAKLPLDCQKYRELDIGFDVKKVELGLAESERGVTPTGRTMDLPGARDIHSILRDRFAAILKARKNYSAAELGEVARKLAGVKDPAETGFTVKEVATVDLEGGAKLTRVAFTYPDGLYLPAVYVTPAKVDPAKAPLLMIGGKGRKAWAGQVADAIASGTPALVADITGFGEIGKPNKVFYGADDCPEEGISVMLYLMGESMVGRRATDMLVLAGWLKGKAGAAPELLAQGTAAVPAAHAKAVAPAAFAKVSVFDAPSSWTEFIEKGDTMKFRYTSTVVNGLLHYDWPDLLK